MSLVISQTNGLIGITTTPGKLDITTKKAQLNLHKKDIQLNIKTRLPRIQIDQHDTFASEGLKGVPDATREAVQEAHSNLLDFINKTVEDGKSYAAIDKPGNVTSQIARRDMFQEHIFVMDYMPKVRPQISLIEGSISFNPESLDGDGFTNGIAGSFEPGYVDFNYTPSQIRIYMQQYPSISMNYQQGSNVDIRI